MIQFPLLRTQRLEVQLQELTIGDEIALCQFPEWAHEQSLSAFLQRVVAKAHPLLDDGSPDPRAWSVGERLLVLAHYCIRTREDGPDFPLAGNYPLSRYLARAQDWQAAPSFEAIGDTWTLQPLSGAAAEVLEAAQAGRVHWVMGAMAAQLMRTQDQDRPDPVKYFEAYQTWLTHRIATMERLPSSDFTILFDAFIQAQQTQFQFFKTWFDDSGIIILPKEAGSEAPPARFLITTHLGEAALSIAGKSRGIAGELVSTI
ncbi:MAG: hypothetical protein RL748_1009 [Pseudomonadota bacterium]|jgi:hypothetical protein